MTRDHVRDYVLLMLGVPVLRTSKSVKNQIDRSITEDLYFHGGQFDRMTGCRVYEAVRPMVEVVGDTIVLKQD